MSETRLGIGTRLIGYSAATRVLGVLLLVGMLWGAISWAVRLP